MRLHRVVPVLLYLDGFIVRSKQFTSHSRIGDPFQQMRRYMNWDTDEIVYLDIGKKNSGARSLLDHLPEISRNCFSPLAVGGNIHTLGDIENHLEAGADRVVIGSTAVENPNFISEAASRFGAQAIIVAVDYRNLPQGPAVFIGNGKRHIQGGVLPLVRELYERGAGEILLQSIDRDGVGEGYDFELLSDVCSQVPVPVIACGGASDYDHFVEAIDRGASAVAAANIFGFRELAYYRVKEAMAKASLRVRLVDYSQV